MEVLELFPRYVLKGNLAQTLLSSLQILAKEVLKAPERSPNASHKLAGQLALQLELGPQQPAVQELLGHSDAISAAFIQHLLCLYFSINTTLPTPSVIPGPLNATGHLPYAKAF